MSKNKAILWEELNWKDIIRKAYNENESGNHSASSPSDLGGGVFRGALLVSQVFNDGYTARAMKRWCMRQCLKLALSLWLAYNVKVAK